MKLLALAAIATWALPAWGEPARCPVTIVRAPDDVRSAIDAWLRDETSCGAALELEISHIATGISIHARDARGRTRERIVPDVQTAAALIASWAADDRVELEPPATAAPVSAVPIVPSPGLSLVTGTTSSALAPRTVMLAGAIGSEPGAHAEVDLLGERWVIGIAGEAHLSTIRVYGEERDLVAMGYVARSRAWGRLRGRVVLGAGVEVVDMRMVNDTNQVWARGWDSVFVTQASAMLSRDLGASWSMTGGLAVTVIPRSTISIDQMSVRIDLPVVAPQLVVGVTYRR